MFAIGVGLIVVCVLGQIPAVLLLARYCERDDDVPPSVRFWQTGDEKPPYDSPDSVDSENPFPGIDEESRGVEAVTTELAENEILCRRCQTINEDLYRYCQHCLAQLR